MISNELAKRGHNITVISPFNEETPPSNVHYILIENQLELITKPFVKAILNATETINPFIESYLLQESYYNICKSK